MPLLRSIFDGLISLGSFLDAHNGAISAISAVLIAGFTFTLWRATARLWEISRRELDHSEDTAERQLRAYILVKEGRLLTEAGIGARLCFKNYGRTPAYDVTFALSVLLFDGEEARVFQAPELFEGKSIVGPSAEIVRKRLAKNGPDLNGISFTLTRMLRREAHLFAWGEVTYRDAFNKQRSSRYRLRYERDKSQLIPCDEGNEAE